MTFRKPSWHSMALGLLFALSLSSPAMAQSNRFAESGNWWDTARPGEGLVLERQGNTVAMILFTYTASGEPDFYIATGQIGGTPFPGTPVPEGAAFNSIEGTLLRFKNGPVLNSDQRYFESDPPANETEPVGTIRASTRPFSDTLVVQITLDENKVPEGSQRHSSRSYRKSAFGYAGMGKAIGDASEPLQATQSCWVDLRGRWVFVDQSSAATRNAWSFNFTELETSPAPQDMICPDDSPHVLRYRDIETGATLRCVAKYGQPLGSPDYDANDWRCVLRTADDEPLLWFSGADVAAKQIIGTLGAPPEAYSVFRGPPSRFVIGLRLD